MADRSTLQVEPPPSYSDVLATQPPPYNTHTTTPSTASHASDPPEPQGVYPPRAQGYSPPQADAVHVTQPNNRHYPHSTRSPPSSLKEPNDFLALSIFTTTLCFIALFGVVGCIAIGISLQVERAWKRGEVQRAKRYSRTAFILNIVNVFAGILMLVAVLVPAGLFYLLPQSSIS